MALELLQQLIRNRTRDFTSSRPPPQRRPYFYLRQCQHGELVALRAARKPEQPLRALLSHIELYQCARVEIVKRQISDAFHG